MKKNKILAWLLCMIMIVVGISQGTVYTKAALTDVYYTQIDPNRVAYGSDDYALFVDDYYCSIDKKKGAFLYATKCKGDTLTFPSTIAYNQKIYKSYAITEYIGNDISEFTHWHEKEFENKKKVKKIIVPENIEGVMLFLSTWKNVKEIRLPASAKTATLGHTTAKIIISKKNKYIEKYKNGLYTKKNPTLKSTYGNKSTFTIKKGTKYIGYCAFYGYKKLKKLVIPPSVKEIDGLAFFRGCKNLNTIVLEGKKAPKLVHTWDFRYLNKKCKIYVKNKKIKKSIEKQLKGSGFKGKVIVKK